MLMASGSLWSKEIAIVAGPGFPASTLTREEARDIFLGEKVMLQGNRLRPLETKEPKGLRGLFFKAVLSVSEDGYQSYWIKKVFQDGGTPPSSLTGVEALVAALQTDHNALGFLWASDASKIAGLKTLLVITIKE
ncbi:MAG: hypothetical protein HY547_00250 [Elusimicrobia bacterium]|nr:hypothetical protein [Elusimicrobiota bacterium]